MFCCLHSIHALRLWEVRFIGNKLGNLEQENSRWPIIPAVEYTLLAGLN